MIHENSSQAETHGMKLYSITYSTWNNSFSDLNRHNILAVGNGAEDAIQRTKEMVERDARDFRAEEISDVMGFRIYTGASIGQDRMDTPVERFTGAVRLTIVTARLLSPLRTNVWSRSGANWDWEILRRQPLMIFNSPHPVWRSSFPWMPSR